MTRLRTNEGFTLVEVLVAATIGFIVLAAVMGLLESTLRLSGGVMAKTDAMQRGRLAMDRVTQQLRSQVCPSLDIPAIHSGDPSSVTFYADLTEGAPVPNKRVLSLIEGNITETVYAGSRAGDGTPVWSTTPQRRNVILENVVSQSPSRPFLRYFAYTKPIPPAPPEPKAELSPPLDDSERARVARIEIAFTARPTRAVDDKNAVLLNDQVIVRHSDPNQSVPDPACT
jgi:type II secretory pathway pseudopilin PulG